MTHEEFVNAILESGDFTEPNEINRLTTEGAILSAGWIRRIMEAVPSAGEYLAKRSPDAWRQYEEVQRKMEESRKE